MQKMINYSQDEESRIREVYSKRSPNGRYTFFNSGHLFMLQERERVFLDILQAVNINELNQKTILDIGCGTGHWVRDFIKWGASPEKVCGIDLLPDRVVRARQLCPSAVQLQCKKAEDLDFPDKYFDIVLQATVFSSILNWNLKQEIAQQMLRVVKNDGVIVWYDFHVNNPWNPDVRGVKKKEIAKLFPGCQVKLHRITLFPHAVRLFARYSWMSCYFLEKLKIFNTHYLGIIYRG